MNSTALKTAFEALGSGDARRAERIGRDVLAVDADAEGALLLLALSLDAQGRSIEALLHFKRLTEVAPNVPAHWNNLGNLQRMLGQRVEATLSLDHAIRLDETDAGALYNRALLHLDNGEFHAARTLLTRALRAAPDDAAIRAEAASACFMCGDTARTNELLESWPQWTAGDALTLADVGFLFSRLGQAEDAGQALDAAHAIMPRHPRIQLRRAAFLERSNRIEEARAMLSSLDPRAVKAEGLEESAAVVRAEVAARGEDLDGALAAHEALVGDPATARRHPQLLTAIARMYEKKGDVVSTMSWLDRAHAQQIEELRSHAPHWFEPGADPLGITRHRIGPAEHAQWTPLRAPDAQESPIFVVGFPRSGTTMLETMLDAHPLLAGMDERTFVQDVVEALRSAGFEYPQDIGRIDDALADRLRDVYWRLVRTRARIAPGKRLVDKNPLNILRLPLIARLFPNARIILALRHPCDVVLSNYMQTFRTPAYVSLTASIESTARGYADTFAFWLDQVGVLAPNVLELRYEDVVDDIEGQSRRIADFVGVDWDARMVNFHERAKERGFIATPSYHQVIEPINRKGVARWERYRSHLEPAIPLLQPYIERWNYTV